MPSPGARRATDLKASRNTTASLSRSNKAHSLEIARQSTAPERGERSEPTRTEQQTTNTLLTTSSNLLGSVGGGGG